MRTHYKKINEEKNSDGKNYYFGDIQKKGTQTLEHTSIIFSR
jgi:hypothetical protein